MKHSRARLVALAVAVGAAATCARNPVTGKPQLSLISEQQEIQMGRQQAQQVAQTMGLVKDDALQAYVDRIGKSIAARTERPNLPWTFRVVDDPTPNAFSLPGGFIFVTRGLMTDMNDEAELALVLGHEIGHATARHVVNQMSKQELAQLGLGLGVVLVPGAAQFGQLASAGLQVLFLKFSRDDERQADDLGFRYALADHYNVRDGIQVFDTLKRLSDRSGGGRVPTWLQTHPDPGARIQTLTKKADETKVNWAALTVDRRQYLSQVNGLVYGQDPRQGYMMGNTFVAPALRFEITFPAGWKVDNQPEAVVAASPQQNAVEQLSVVGTGSPEQAASKFASQQGIQARQYPGRCGGELQGTCVQFSGQTQQGPIAGYAGFLDLEGKVLMVAAYGSSQAASANASELQGALNAVRKVDDPRLLDVKPARIELVTVDQPMTVAQFTQRYPSTIPPDLVALINGLQMSDSVAAGTELKRVTGGTPAGEREQTGSG